MKSANLVLIPSPGTGHLIPAVELAKQLVARDSRLSVTVLVTRFPFSVDNNLESHLASLKADPSLISQEIRFIDLPPLEEKQVNPKARDFLTLYMEAYQPKIKNVVQQLQAAGPPPLVGLVVDMFCSAMIDVATDLDLPSYVLFTTSASLLSIIFHLEELGIDVAAKYDSQPPDTAVEFPAIKNPVPLKVWPRVLLEEDGGTSTDFLRHAKRYRQAKGILVNTFSELESDSIHSMLQEHRIPPIYPVGPILNLNLQDQDQDRQGGGKTQEIFNWLDAQPSGSVVFLCFGSRGYFNEKQVKEIAAGLERSGHRFLWSLRREPSKDAEMAPLSEFDDVSSVLPEGFLERTAEIGKVIGWAPQVRVLEHRAISAFVSHCGWNSTLESVWFGVPIVAWPMYAEQQLNAFLLVKEMGLAAEIRIDYRRDFREEMLVGAAELEEGIRRVVDENDEGAAALRKKVKDMSDKARKAKVEGGSSYESLDRFLLLNLK